MQIEKGQWHLDKRVSLGTLSLLLVNLIALVVLFVKADTRITWLEEQKATDARIAVIEQNAVHARREVEKLEDRTTAQLEEIKSLLRDIRKDMVLKSN